MLRLSISPNLILNDTHYTHWYSLILTEQFADVHTYHILVHNIHTHGIYNVHICMFLVLVPELPPLLCAGHHPCYPSLSLLHWCWQWRYSVGRLLVCLPAASLHLLAASNGWETPKECILQKRPWWPLLPPGLLQHLWGAETAHQWADGVCWGDQVVWALADTLPVCGSSSQYDRKSSTDPLVPGW